jgi:hypothetical protein
VSFGGNTVNGPFYGSQPQRVGPMPPPMPQPSWPQPNYGPRIDGLARQLNMLNQVLMRIEGKVDQVLDKDQDNAGYPMQPGDPLALGPQKVPETKEEVNDILAKAAATKRAYEEMEEERMLERGPAIFNPPFKANPHRTQWHPNEDFNPKDWNELVAGVKEARQRVIEQDENLKAIKRSTAMDVQHSSDMREGIRKDQLDIEGSLKSIIDELGKQGQTLNSQNTRISTVESVLAGLIPRVAKLERLGDELDRRTQQDAESLVSILGRLDAIENDIGKMSSGLRYETHSLKPHPFGKHLEPIPVPTMWECVKELSKRLKALEVRAFEAQNAPQSEAKIEDGSEAGIEGKSP